MKSEHTPGPWETNTLYSKVITPTKEICDVSVNANEEGFTYDEWRANARLIAAAPDLLEALEGFEKAFEISNERYVDWVPTSELIDAFHHALNIINKAKGL